jgi:hypothetical protein
MSDRGGLSLAMPSFKVSAVGRRRQSGVLAKRGRKRTGVAEAQVEADLRHRHGGIRQKRLGPLHAKAAQIAMWRQAE